MKPQQDEVVSNPEPALLLLPHPWTFPSLSGGTQVPLASGGGGSGAVVKSALTSSMCQICRITWRSASDLEYI
jgi:hypothetical protein